MTPITKDKRRNKRRSLHLQSFVIYLAIQEATMAQSPTSVILHRMRGAIGKQIVVKQYGNKTVITAYPDMSNVKPSKLQKLKRKKFAAAIEYARSIIRDPVKKAALEGADFHAMHKFFEG